MGVGTLASPVAIAGRDEDYAGIELFKRDAVLTPRDFELAEVHGVNLTEMYKHSMMKRDDGNHVTFWVNRSFMTEEDAEAASELEARQTTRKGAGAVFTSTPGASFRDQCNNHKRSTDGVLTAAAPAASNVNHIYMWAHRNDGFFEITMKNRQNKNNWQNLVVSGTNDGQNALYRAAMKGNPSRDRDWIGSFDVRNDADWTFARYKHINNNYRAASHGGQDCVNVRVLYEIIRTKYNV